jgi:hypothetical protein
MKKTLTLFAFTLFAFVLNAQIPDTQFGTNGEIYIGPGANAWDGWGIPQLIHNENTLYSVHYGSDTLRVRALDLSGSFIDQFGESGLLDVPFDNAFNWPWVYNRSYVDFLQGDMIAWRVGSDNMADEVLAEFEVLKLNPQTGALETSFATNGRLQFFLPGLDVDSLLGYGFHSAVKVENYLWFAFSVNSNDSYLICVNETGELINMWSTDGLGGTLELDILGNEYTSERISKLALLNGTLCTAVSCKDSNNQSRAFLVSITNGFDFTSELGGDGIMEIDNEGSLVDYYSFTPDIAVWNNYVYIYDLSKLRRIDSETAEADPNWDVDQGTINANEITFNPIFDYAGRIFSPGYIALPSQMTLTSTTGQLSDAFGGDGIFSEFQSVSSPYMNILDIVYKDNLSLYVLLYGAQTEQAYESVYVQKYIYDTTNLNDLEIKAVEAFPNPTSDEVFISGIWSSYTVFDITGRVIVSDVLNGKAVINCNNWPEGIYHMVLHNGEEYATAKVIKL